MNAWRTKYGFVCDLCPARSVDYLYLQKDLYFVYDKLGKYNPDIDDWPLTRGGLKHTATVIMNRKKIGDMITPVVRSQVDRTVEQLFEKTIMGYMSGRRLASLKQFLEDKKEYVDQIIDATRIVDFN